MGIFPNREAVIRLIGAVLAEQHRMGRTTPYLGLEALTKARGVLTARTTTEQPQEVNTDLIAATITA